MSLNQMANNCYIHIPFCNHICSYCDFSKLLYNDNLVNRYLIALEKDINKNYKGEILETIYIGGGTPSSLNIEQLTKLFKIISKLNIDKDLEYTIECNFDTIDKKKLLLFKKYGINRLSFGLESVSKKNLKLLERYEGKEIVKEKISLARSLNFNNINIDLMYAIPKEDMGDLEKDIDFILSLNPEHISCYSLIIEKNTKLFIKNIKYIDEEVDFLMYNYICKKLNDKYIHYEISNFSKDGYFSKHNLCYWNNLEYYGFGLSAAGYINDIRYTNTKSITNYLEGITRYDEEYVDLSSKMSYEMILGLRKLEGVSKRTFKDKYKKEIIDEFQIKDLISKKLLIDSKDSIRISEENLYISNEILIHFLKE